MPFSSSKEEELSNNGSLLLQRVETRATTMAAQQFLNSVLSQRGPSSLPYPDDVKWLIRQHLLSLSSEFPSLHPRTSTFTHNDGRSLNLLRAEGTIPISFHGVSYNLPILIWLTESYPHRPPSVFLNPTREMLIKRPHPFVNPSGLVSSPLLLHWLYPSSNLLDLTRSLSLLFGLDPPLFSRPPPNPSPSLSDHYGLSVQNPPSENPNSSFSPPSISTNSNNYGPSESLNSSSSTGLYSRPSSISNDYGLSIQKQNRPSENPNSSSSTGLYSNPSSISNDYGLSIQNQNRPSDNPNLSSTGLYSRPSSISNDYGLLIQDRPSEDPNSSFSRRNSDDYGLSIHNRPSGNSGSSFYRRNSDDFDGFVGRGDGEEVYRRDLVSKVVERLGGDLVELRRVKEGEIEGVFELQRSLREREGELRKGLREMMEEKEGLEQQLQMVLMNSDVLGEWVRENEAKVEETVNLSAGNAFEPFDAISKQMLECTSSDLAIEDVIYALDKAAHEGCMPFDLYLKNVRLLSREQFFHRAMASKIRSVAVHSHISRMAARASHVS